MNRGNVLDKSVQKIKAYIREASEVRMEAIDSLCKDKLFGNFYKVFLKAAFLYFREKTNTYPEICFENILIQIYERIENIPIRVLIEDIHHQKEAKRLQGETSQEEYAYYQKRFLDSDEYVKKLCVKYPVMEELILLQIYRIVEYVCEIQTALTNDKAVIEKTFCEGKKFYRVSNISMNLSDPHKNGKTVVKIDLDNGYCIIYKPHGLRKELLLNEIYRAFMENCSLQLAVLDVIDRECYGWEKYIETKGCNTEEEVKRYFQRMGALLFVCYLFGATDIHCENIIASGEFPILIDLETIPGTFLKKNLQTAEDCVKEKINHSVMRTGILPTAVWGKNGGGVVVSALGNGFQMKTPFKLPCILNGFSSDIQIGYMQKDISTKGSLPEFQGKAVNAADFCEQLCFGFEAAYRSYIGLQERLEPVTEAILEQPGRFIFRHTQQYSMYMNISFFPQFLKNWEAREDFFENLRKHKEYMDFYRYEKQALKKMEIPIFEIVAKSSTIYDGEGCEYNLPNFIIDQEHYKRKHFCEQDLEYQKRSIRLSLDMLTERRLPNLKANHVLGDGVSLERLVTGIADEICRNAVIYGEDVCWENIIFFDNHTWNSVPVSLDLYDGIGGIVIFLKSVCKRYPSEIYEKICGLAEKKLFHYTDANEKEENVRTEESGILKGEGSIVYTYLLLYKMTGKRDYLAYAEKHYTRFEKVLLNCKNPDYLSGSAGAMIVLVKLYMETKHKKYLDAAEMLGDTIWKNAKKQKTGYGIVNADEEQDALAGMAHGTSGYIMAYAYLFAQLPKSEYQERIMKLLAYENSLYDAKIHNWRDLRRNDAKQNMLAWCHGAPGIALARLKLNSIETFQNREVIQEDIAKCLQAFQYNQKKDSLCLCHGLAGNHWIEKEVMRLYGARKEHRLQENLSEIIKRLSVLGGMLPRERYNVSLMTGLPGIGLLLNDEDFCREIFL